MTPSPGGTALCRNVIIIIIIIIVIIIITSSSISWCDNLVPNVYGTEVFLTCSLHDAQDVIIFQVIISLCFSQLN